MKTNSDITIYHRYIDATTRTEKYQRSQVRGVLWENRKAAHVIATGGNLAANQANIYIPYQRGAGYVPPNEWKPGKWTMAVGDVIVRGLVNDEITSTFTVSDLKKKYDSVMNITSIDTMDMGSAWMNHWQVGVV